MSRIDLLVKIAELLTQPNLSEEDKNGIQEVRDKFLCNEISIEDTYNEISKFPIISSSEDWYNIIRNKPIHKNLINILNDKITDNDEVAKIVASMLTQLIIRKIADPTIDYQLLNFGVYLDLLNNYYKTGIIDVSKFKSIIKAYENLGIIRDRK